VFTTAKATGIGFTPLTEVSSNAETRQPIEMYRGCKMFQLFCCCLPSY